MINGRKLRDVRYIRYPRELHFLYFAVVRAGRYIEYRLLVCRTALCYARISNYNVEILGLVYRWGVI